MGEVVLHAIRCLCRRADDDVLFGATGDLARRKLLPRLFHVFDTGVLPQRWRLIGIGEHGLSTGWFHRASRRLCE